MLDNTKIIEETGALYNLTDEDRKMLKRQGTRMSSRMCGVLRHEPEAIGVTMDKQAWVSAEEFIEKFNKVYGGKYYLNLPVLMELVRTDNKQRYGLKWEGDVLMLRCRQGHSIPWLEMDYRVEIPPEILYHGTVSAYLPSILKEGLKPMSRQKVHLSADVSTARSVAGRGKRKELGMPVILQLETGQMAKDGVVFYLSDNDVWLTDYVDPKYLSVKAIDI